MFEFFNTTFLVMAILIFLIAYALLLLILLTCGMLYFLYSNFRFAYTAQKHNGTKTALITGGSSGIGFELAKMFLVEEWNIVIVSSDQRKLLTAKKILEAESRNSKILLKIVCLKLDLSLPGCCRKLYNALKKKNVHIDCLVNNAGFGFCGTFDDQKLGNIQRMMQLNMVTMTTLTKMFLPGMIKNNFGRILNISSYCDTFPTPNYAVYAATKAYVTHLSNALYEELLSFPNISVTCCSPGFVRTNFNARALRGRTSMLSKGMRYMEAEDCAYEAFRALMKKERHIIPGPENWIFVKFVAPFVPTKIGLKILSCVTDYYDSDDKEIRVNQRAPIMESVESEGKSSEHESTEGEEEEESEHGDEEDEIENENIEGESSGYPDIDEKVKIREKKNDIIEDSLFNAVTEEVENINEELKVEEKSEIVINDKKND